MWKRIKAPYPTLGWIGWVRPNNYGTHRWTAVSANGAHETYHVTLAHAVAWLREL